MKRYLAFCSLLLVLPSALFGERGLHLAAGYRNGSFYDQVYSPAIYTGNGFDMNLGVYSDKEILTHRVELDFSLLPASLYRKENPTGFDVLYHGGEVSRNEIGFSQYTSGSFGFELSYGVEFRFPSRREIANIAVGPVVSIHTDLIGLETYCLAYSLGVSTGGRIDLQDDRQLRFSLSAPMISLINRPAYVLFDNQILENFERNWMREFFHIDKVTHVLSGDFYSVNCLLLYEIPLSEDWETSFGYRGYFQYCSIPDPDKLFRLDHNLIVGLGLKFQ